MIDRAKVLEGLQCCVRSDSEAECPTEFPYYRKCWEDDYPDGDLALSLHKDALELLKIQPQWISVKKKLPEQAGYSCLVSAEYGDGKRAEFIAFTGYGESEWYTYDALFMEKEREADNRVHHNYHITHWIPLPEPPKEVKP